MWLASLLVKRLYGTEREPCAFGEFALSESARAT
jgi:hypothetical protein